MTCSCSVLGSNNFFSGFESFTLGGKRWAPGGQIGQAFFVQHRRLRPCFTSGDVSRRAMSSKLGFVRPGSESIAETLTWDDGDVWQRRHVLFCTSQAEKMVQVSCAGTTACFSPPDCLVAGRQKLALNRLGIQEIAD